MNPIFILALFFVTLPDSKLSLSVTTLDNDKNEQRGEQRKVAFTTHVRKVSARSRANIQRI